MLTHPTLDLLHSLGLHGMAKGFKDLDAQPEARFKLECMAGFVGTRNPMRNGPMPSVRQSCTKLLKSQLAAETAMATKGYRLWISFNY